ncbi:MAG: alanyl-tRNA editing protein [Natronomonas sp.]
MTESRAAADPETLAFEATVTEGGNEIVLSETYFYPEGGGQPADRGSIGGRTVLDVRTEDGDVVHEIDGHLEAGDSVDAAVDPDFRRYCMRAHTASHVLYGAGRRIFEDVGYGGFGISEDKIRVDFATSSEISDATLVELERLVNRCVWDSRPVTWEAVPREDALGRPEVAFNTKTEEGVTGETVRLVEIDGWDEAACGGTHVSNTREIGPVSLLDRSNPGEGLTRITFAVGPAGIEHRSTEKAVALESSARLGTRIDDVPDALARLEDERAALEDERNDLRDRVLNARLSELKADTFEREGATWLAGVVDLGVEVDVLTERVRDRPDGVDVAVLVTPSGRIAVGTNGDIDAGSVVDDLTDTFGGGGGGSETAAQGGGLSADGEAVIKHIRS